MLATSYMRRVLKGLAVLAAGVFTAHAAAQDLVIITPHNEHIQQEFGRGFQEYVGKPVEIRWIKQGTSELIQLLRAKDRATPKGSFDIDLFFGGGVPDHQFAGQLGFLQQAKISEEVISGIPAKIAGIPNYDRAMGWYSAAVSSFGILVNDQARKTHGLPGVAEWKDIADPEYFGWVVLADPRKSASNQVCYEAILQQYGWEKGWSILMRIAANARHITSSSSAVPNEIASGNVVAGPAVDFYAFARIARTGNDVLSYVQPKGGTAITPDPISMLRRPPNEEYARKFMEFTLGPAGQKLWLLPPGAKGGPENHALYRLAVRPDVYAMCADDSSAENPYDMANQDKFRILDDKLQERRLQLLAESMGAAMVDLHTDLHGAWEAVIDGGMNPEALDKLLAVPFSESDFDRLTAELSEGGRPARKLVRSWVREFKQRYAEVRRLAGS